jgi:hypothetical protein
MMLVVSIMEVVKLAVWERNYIYYYYYYLPGE